MYVSDITIWVDPEPPPPVEQKKPRSLLAGWATEEAAALFADGRTNLPSNAELLAIREDLGVSEIPPTQETESSAVTKEDSLQKEERGAEGNEQCGKDDLGV